MSFYIGLHDGMLKSYKLMELAETKLQQLYQFVMTKKTLCLLLSRDFSSTSSFYYFLLKFPFVENST